MTEPRFQELPPVCGDPSSVVGFGMAVAGLILLVLGKWLGA